MNTDPSDIDLLLRIVEQVPSATERAGARRAIERICEDLGRLEFRERADAREKREPKR